MIIASKSRLHGCVSTSYGQFASVQSCTPKAIQPLWLKFELYIWSATHVSATHVPDDYWLTAGMLGYVVLLEHLRRLMYLYHVFTILQTVSIVLLVVQFWRKW